MVKELCQRLDPEKVYLEVCQREIIFIELMVSDHTLKASREVSK